MIALELTLALLLLVAGLADLSGQYRRAKIMFAIVWLSRITTKLWSTKCPGSAVRGRYHDIGVCTAGTLGFHATMFLNLILCVDSVLVAIDLYDPGAALNPPQSWFAALRDLIMNSPVMHVETRLARRVIFINTPAAIIYNVVRFNIWMPKSLLKISWLDGLGTQWIVTSLFAPWVACILEAWENPYFAEPSVTDREPWDSPAAQRKLMYNRDRLRFWRRRPGARVD